MIRQLNILKLTVLFVLAANFIKAQSANESVFSLKPAIGINGAQIHGDSYSGFDKAGIFGGTAVNARFSEKISLDLGFYFSQKGARHNQNPEKGDYTFYNVTLNYIDLPVSLVYFLNKDYFITGGPSIAYLVSYKEENHYGNWTGVWPFERTEYGVNLGLGRKIKEKFLIEVRTSNSFMPIRPYGLSATGIYYPNPVARFFNRGLYNNILTLFLSYKLDLKRKTS